MVNATNNSELTVSWER